MRLAFMGTPDFAVPTLDALVAEGHEVAAVYSQPPRPGGRRGKELTPSPVHRRAEALGIEVLTPLTLRDAEEQARFAALELDAAVVAAYGLILPQRILEAPRFGCLNVHASLLPRWRGAAPVQRAILAGDRKTGVTIMQMERGLDTGPMHAWIKTGIGTKTAGQLTQELADLGAQLITTVLEILPEHRPRPQPEEGVTYASKIEKHEARLDFTAAAEQVERQVRAFNPTPGAFFEHAGERIRLLNAEVLLRKQEPSEPTDPGLLLSQEHGAVLDAHLTIACGEGAIRPTRVQRAGRGVMTPKELLRGFPIPIGTRLS